MGQPQDLVSAKDANEGTQSYGIERTLTVDPLPGAIQADGGLIVGTEGLDDISGLKLAKDGRTVLIPQPTQHEGDCLNWSWQKKHLVLFTVAWGALCADFVGTVSTATIVTQSHEWNKSLFVANQPTAIVVFFLGIFGLVWVPMVSYWGRAPVLFWTELFGLFFTIATAFANDFATFFVLRIFTAIFITSAQTIALAFLKDIFFFHERARKIGLYACLYISSPYIGPMMANFVAGKTGDWRDVYWMCAGLLAVQVIFVLCFIDETWFDRSMPSHDQPPRPQTFTGRISRVLGFWQLANHGYFHTVRGSYRALWKVILQPHFALICVCYFMLFMWGVGINIATGVIFGTPVEFGGYGYNNVQMGYLYFSPIIGTVIAEFFGHWFNDFTARRYIHKHHGVFEPEVRLWPIYIAAFFTVPGLIIFGQSIFHHWHWIGVAAGWAVFSVGIMLTSVAVIAYSLDALPMAPAEVAAWLNMARTMGGFIVGYFQEPWGNAVGYDVSFGIQAIIVALSVVPAILVHKYGHRLRTKSAAKNKNGYFRSM